MKKYLLPVLALISLLYACNEAGNSNGTVSSHYVDSINRFCPDSSMPNELCSMLPYDINEKFGQGYSSQLSPTIQPPFDIFSWQSFVALNWPADSLGNPLKGSIGDHPDAQRVWEYYPDIQEIFSNSSPLQLQLQDARKSKQKFFYMTSKSPHPLDSLGDFRDADGYPLIDRNLNFAVFEVKSNPVEADFIRKNNLNTLSGIVKFSTPIGNPKDSTKRQITLPSSDVAKKEVGSMEIKTTWRILDSAKGGDQLSRYYTRDAVIFIGDSNSVTGKGFTIRTKVGLVGMHIIRKTALFGKWIWSTFEHTDNTPDNLQEAQMDQNPKIPWSFYYPGSIGLQPNNPVSFLPGDFNKYKFDTSWPYAKRYAVSVPGERDNLAVYGTQAQRMYPIYYTTQQVNALWRAKLAGTVWANYKLIGSQWATSTLTPGAPMPVAPFMMGNTTLETFSLSTASCIGCHNGASINYNKDNVFCDFSYMIALHAK